MVSAWRALRFRSGRQARPNGKLAVVTDMARLLLYENVERSLVGLDSIRAGAGAIAGRNYTSAGDRFGNV